MVDEVGDGPVDGWRGQQMVVIQDECHLFMEQGSQLIDPDSQDGFYGREVLGLRALEQSPGRLITARVDARKSCEYIRPEAYEVVIVTRQSHPGS
jgi:hypothetical protein